MFERQRTSSTARTSRQPAKLTMTDGEVLHAGIALPLSGRLFDAMNNADGFLDVETAEGQRYFVAKHTVRKVEPVEIPRVDQLMKRASEVSVFDPHAVLGVAKTADPETLKQAYHAMARKYHPDRFAMLDLPQEMRDYASAMLVRINLAHEQLSG